MLNIGAHLSISKGFLACGKEATSIGANTFQFFTRNPRGGKAKEIDPNDTNALLEYMKENNFSKILAHAPYTLNPCSKTEKTTTVLLETMAGKGTEVGSKFQELKEILDGVTLNEKMGVCLDTCHVFDGGYDIKDNLEDVLEEFDKIIGIHKLKAIHLNDSKNFLGCHKDRHEKIGEGGIGLDALVGVINHPKLKDLPFFLETPNDLDGYKAEITLLRENYKF